MSDEAEILAADALLLERAVRESWPRTRPELRELLARRPDWSAVLEASLSDTAAGEAELERLAQAVTEEDRRLVDETLALARGSSRSVQRRGPLSWLLVAAGLALCLGGVAWWSALATPPFEPVQRLGDGTHGSAAKPALTCSVQDPAGPERGILRWEAAEPLSEGQSFEIVVHACAGEGRTGRELARARIQASPLLPREELTSWTLPSEVLAQTPDCFEWSVTLLDANGLAVASDSARVQRSAR